jgi:ABC-type sugar transport system ATPase subunit
LAGLLDPTEGTILFDGKDVTKAAPKDRNIGMVFQSYALYPHLTVLDNIAFPLKQKGVPKHVRYAKARDVANKLQIHHLLDRAGTAVRGSSRCRLVCAFVKEPEILLLDEPMSNLDARSQDRYPEVIKASSRTRGYGNPGHPRPGEAMALSDQIAILDGGNPAIQYPVMLYECPNYLLLQTSWAIPR